MFSFIFHLKAHLAINSEWNKKKDQKPQAMWGRLPLTAERSAGRCTTRANDDVKLSRAAQHPMSKDTRSISPQHFSPHLSPVFTLHLCFIFYFFLIIKNHSHQFMVIPVSRVDSRWCQRDFPAQNCDVEKDWEPYGQFQKNNMAGSKSWKLSQNCFIRMNRPSSKTINSRALIGKLKRFNNGTRRFFQLATSPTASSQNLFEEFTGDPLDLREIQTYPQWKVQTCFRNLNRHQKKRSTQRKIYILPIGPFPEVLWRPLHGMEVSIFDLIANFAAVFFHGMTVKVVDEVLATEVKCKKRIHPETGKLQLLVTGKVRECWVINI